MNKTKITLGLLVVAAAAGGMSLAGEACKHSAEKAAFSGEKSGCKHAVEKAAWSGEKSGCKHSTAKRGAECDGCEAMFKSHHALRDAGAEVEVVQTKRGYIVIALAGSRDDVKAVRRANAASLESLQRIGENGNGHCRGCESFHAALDSGRISLQEVELDQGVMTVFTANGEEAVSALKGSCKTFCGLKAEADIPRETIHN